MLLNHSFLKIWRNTALSMICKFTYFTLKEKLQNSTQFSAVTFCPGWCLSLSLSWFLVLRQPSILTQSSSVLRTSKIIALLGYAITCKLMRNSPWHGLFFGIPSQGLPLTKHNFPCQVKQGGTYRINQCGFGGDSGVYKRPFSALMKLSEHVWLSALERVWLLT